MCSNFFYVSFVFKDCVYLYLERQEGREKERERNINLWLPLLRPLLGTWPATQACAVTGNRTGDHLVLKLFCLALLNRKVRSLNLNLSSLTCKFKIIDFLLSPVVADYHIFLFYFYSVQNTSSIFLRFLFLMTHVVI